MRSYINWFCLAVIVSTVSCKKDFLNKAPDNDLSIAQVFQNKDYAQSFLSDIYASLPIEHRWVDNDPNGNPFVGASDELEQGYAPSFSNSMNTGAWNQNTYIVDPWTSNYTGIRKACIFIENIDQVPLDNQFTSDMRTRLKGEALFLRAYFHFLLIRVYGPVPIVNSTVPLSADFNAIRRNSIDSCVSFITSECDKAAALLPDRITDETEYGRPAKSVCLALKSRALLYMASPLWNGNPDYTGIKDDKGTQLFPNYDASRWQTAATAAKACIDQAAAAGYALYTSATSDPVKNYQELFYTNNNQEVFFSFNCGYFNDHDVYSEPLSLLGFTLNAPTQDLVDDYEMANGTQPILGYNTTDHSPVINPVSGYTEAGFTAAAGPDNLYVAGTSNMYVNRDPRFYASIQFSGAIWKSRTDGLEFWYNGADGKLAAGSGDYTKTGYLVKKICNPDFSWVPLRSILRTWILFRLGEQYLNYAEALNEAQGAVSDVYKYVNLIRARSGMPALPSGLSQDDMRTRIHHERRIELAFEAARYFDCHRWKIAETTDNTNVYGLNIYAGASKTDPAFFKRVPVELRVFQKKHYLWPMQQREIDKNPNLVQNLGW